MKKNEEQQQVWQVFDEGLDLDAEQRRRLLARRFPNQPAQADEVAMLWRMDEEPGFEPIPHLLFPLTLEEPPPPPSFDKFSDLTKIGAGGMGTVYRAHELELDRPVALKILPRTWSEPALYARFQQEVRLLAMMNHPNIAVVHGTGKLPDERPFFYMEYLEGQPLHRWLAQDTPDLPSVLEVFTGICRGVEHAHRKRVVHRDLKPANIVVVAGTPKLIDFGIAMSLGTDQPTMGTPGYLAPEVLAGERPDTRSDTYALGIILSELSAPFPPNKERTAIVAKATHRDPESRYESVAAFRDDLRAHREDYPVKAMGAGNAYVLNKWMRRHYRGLAAALVVLVLSGSLLFQAQETRIQMRETEAMTYLMEHFLRSPDPLIQGREVRAVDLLEQAYQGLEAYRGLPQSDVRLTLALARSSRELGDYEKARTLFEKALHIWETRLDPNEPEAVQALAEYAFILRNLGDFQAAEAGYEKVLTRLKNDIDGQTYLYAAGGLADLLAELGRFADAETRFKEVITTLTAIEGPSGDRTLANRTNLGKAYARAGRLADSERELAATVALYQQRERPDHPRALIAQHLLAMTRERLGKTDLGAYRAILEARRQVLGAAHPHTLETQNNLANLLAGRDLEEAVALLEDAMVKGAHGLNHPVMLTIQHNLGNWALKAGNLDAAQTRLSDVLERRRSQLGPNHAGTLVSACTLGEVFIAQKRFPEAHEILADTYRRARESLGETHGNTAIYRALLGVSLHGLGRHEEAEGHLEAGHQILSEAGNPNAAWIGELQKEWRNQP